jgi:hypothetical protein
MVKGEGLVIENANLIVCPAGIDDSKFPQIIFAGLPY